MYVIINAASSVDGKIDSFERKGAGISSEEDRRRVLELRAEVDAVVVGGHTLLKEDPKLTVKLPELRARRLQAGLPENPAKVGIVTRADLDPAGGFINAGPARRIIFTTAQTSPAQVNILQEFGVEVFMLGEKRVDLSKALTTLSALGIERLLVEGGGTLIAEFLHLGLADELQLYIAPKIFGGASAPTLVDGPGWSAANAKKIHLAECQIFDESGGVLLRYHLR
ncbi:MAG: 2,5-diamino-6-(ribosylamino)-4(3H)-pyrimidinone 5'-phosphate reductase [Anaerolineales bacterium]